MYERCEECENYYSRINKNIDGDIEPTIFLAGAPPWSVLGVLPRALTLRLFNQKSLNRTSSYIKVVLAINTENCWVCETSCFVSRCLGAYLSMLLSVWSQVSLVTFLAELYILCWFVSPVTPISLSQILEVLRARGHHLSNYFICYRKGD